MAHLKKYKYILTAFLAAVIAAVFAQGAGATSILDQAQELSNGGVGFYRIRSYAQTFTPATSGQLAQVDLLMSDLIAEPNYPATISIVETVGDVPNGNVLGSFYMSSGFVVGWNLIDFLDQSVMLNAGSKYGVVLQSDEVLGIGAAPTDTFRVQWSGDPYSRGALWKGSLVSIGPDVWSWELPDSPGDGYADGAFRTYMVPEPATLGLLLSPGLLLALRAKRLGRQTM